MKDQYDNDIPDDLVILPGFELLDADEVKKIDQAAWYEAEHPQIGRVLLASAVAIDNLSEDDLEGATGIKLEDCDVCYVAACLHRYNEKDGFYHA
jgi:hypothetical protein